jgi:hypothetical protein
MAAISSVLTKWPKAVKAKKSVRPILAPADGETLSASNRLPARLSSA